MRIVRIDEMPEIREQAAAWFSERWKGHEEEYFSSINDSLSTGVQIPKWYVILKDDQIIAGAGVVSGDPQIQKDKRANVCAVYVEEQYRGLRIAGTLLEYICIDMAFHGVTTLYLTTELTGFYDRYGWELIADMPDGEKTMYVYRHQLNFMGR
jgi:N-acetylglutamate synthase-like GNAT family acetyltransferase